MLFSELFKIMVKKLLSKVLRWTIAPLDPPLVQSFSTCGPRKNLTGHGFVLLKLSTFCKMTLENRGVCCHENEIQTQA